MGIRNDGQKSGDRALVARSGRGNNGLIQHSFKALSRIVSSGASTVASTVSSAASVASAIMERDGETNHDQVSWAGFDKLELERGHERQVLLLGFNHGFQVWDVEMADNVRNIASSRDSAVSFMQIQPKPLTSTLSDDKFAHSRPLLIICADGSFSEDKRCQEGAVIPCNGSIQQYNGSINGSNVSTVVWFYSLKSQSYVHLLKFRSVVHLVRCCSRVVCILQSAQLHCLNAASLEREYTILTNPVISGCNGFGNIGVGPLAVGPRWMAYSGNLVVTSNLGRVTPQHLTPSCSFPAAAASNGSLVAHYAKESSKQLAAGIVTLGDMGYKKLSRYYSDMLHDGQNGHSGSTVSSAHSTEADNVGVVIVRDIVQKTVLAQFQAHKSPISSLCFDPSGTLLVTASIQGHNINIFRIMPGQARDSIGTSYGQSCTHLYRLQRGFTNAVIQDISFSSDSQWIMISSSRGTSHLFAISPFGGTASFQSPDPFLNQRVNGSCAMAKSATRGPLSSGLQVLTPQNICESVLPITLSAVSRIRNGCNGWKNTSGAAAATTGRVGSFSGAISSAFHKCKGNDMQCSMNTLKKNYYLLVFSPSGCLIQYALCFSSAFDGIMTSRGLSIASDPSLNCDVRLIVEAIQKWNICEMRNCKDQGNNMDVYGENGNSDGNKVFPERMKCENYILSESFGSTTKEKITTEEKHHMYISEAELQMHQNTNPLWLRSEIYFQSMLANGLYGENASVGGEIEIEIEKLSTHKLEARSKDLIPVYNYLQTPIFQRGRASNRSRQDSSGSSKLSHESRSGSIDSAVNGSLENVLENGLDALISAETDGDSLNTTNDTPSDMGETQLEDVNIREKSMMENQLSSVNNRHAVAEDDEFD